jgi:hypothetical protein
MFLRASMSGVMEMAFEVRKTLFSALPVELRINKGRVLGRAYSTIGAKLSYGAAYPTLF